MKTTFLREINVSTYMLAVCPCCKQLVPYGSYCTYCGEAIQKDTRTLEVTQCPYCQANTPADGLFCVSCGGKLKK